MGKPQDNRFYRIGRVRISITNEDDAVKSIINFVEEKKGGYICISNMRTVSIANRDDKYQEVMENSLMNAPDGMPLVWMARLWGLKDVQRTVGPDLFTAMLNDKENGIKHFLLGDTEETLAQMQERYAADGANIVGSYSPPFCELDEFDYPSIAKQINDSGANIVWLSLRAPKQDFFAVRLLPYLDKKICIGVGAAFRFSLGQIKHPPKIIKKLGLTGFFWRENKMKLVKWYVINLYNLCCWSINIILSRLANKGFDK